MLNKSTIDTIDVLARKTRADPSFFEKDWYTTQVLNALAKIRDPNFQLVFAGGTSLSKAYKLIQRFSEDIDFRIIQTKRNATPNNRYEFRLKVAKALKELLTQLVIKLGGNEFYRESYRDFVEELTYGESLPFEQAIETLNLLSDRLCAAHQQAQSQQLDGYLSVEDEDPEEIAEDLGLEN